MEVQVTVPLLVPLGFKSGKLRLAGIEACAAMLDVQMRLNMVVTSGSVVIEVSLLHQCVNNAIIVQMHAAGKEVAPRFDVELC
jgi:hypothetical protein